MPPKPTTNTTSKAPKSMAAPAQARKTKATLSKQTPKEKTPAKTPTPSPKPEADSPNPPPLFLFLLPSDLQEDYIHSNDEDENERVSKNDFGDHGFEASEEEPILEWYLHAVANICNVNRQSIVLAVFPDSFPIMNKKGGAGFVKNGFLFTCNDQRKNMAHHHYQCDSPGCPAQLTTIGFTQVKELTIEHDCLGSDMILYYLMRWYLCKAIHLNKELTSTELVTHALLYLNEDQREEVGEKTRLQRYVTDQQSIDANIGVSARSIDELVLLEVQKTTMLGKPFLLHNNRQGSPNHILCFSTQEDLVRLLKCDTWFANGTFASCPKLFYQL
ncbi:hypothetical protein DSO57_1039628 [Entomophthora muscae]|uniref:Uncharacterized protein n=1 Tax=Entomophthora muscae TaxID=34485 RepID=A0ACC2SF36_9FUNG|nr:hypothetical protein DSO57_1039628 [Entomophthora muscae]